MSENQENDVKNLKKLSFLFIALMGCVLLVGIIAGVIAFNVMDGNVASRGQLVIPIMGPMVVVAIAGAIPIRIMKKKMFPTKEAFERATKLLAEQNAQKK